MSTHYDSFIVRRWRFGPGQAQRYQIQHVQSGREWHLSNVEDLLATLQAQENLPVQEAGQRTGEPGRSLE